MVRRIAVLFLLILGVASPVLAAEKETIALGHGRTLVLTEVEAHMHSSAYSVQVMKGTAREQVTIEDLETITPPKLVEEKTVQSTDVPGYDAPTRMLSAVARVGADFFCESAYRLDSQGAAEGVQTHRLVVMRSKCYTYDIDADKETDVQLWKRPEGK